MKENGLVEFRWHGRGGQGAKTACLLLADAAFSSGKFVQGFPAVSYTHLRAHETYQYRG